jgi:GTP cyclohydrolase II
MTDWTKEEDEAFNNVEKNSNLGKQILRDNAIREVQRLGQEIEESGQPYHFDIFVSVSQRNNVLEEIAREIEKMSGFGADTTASFACYVRDMKQ